MFVDNFFLHVLNNYLEDYDPKPLLRNYYDYKLCELLSQNDLTPELISNTNITPYISNYNKQNKFVKGKATLIAYMIAHKLKHTPLLLLKKYGELCQPYAIATDYCHCFVSDSRYTLLNFACLQGNLEFVKYLLNNFDSAKVFEFTNKDFFVYSCETNPELVKYLYDNYPNYCELFQIRNLLESEVYHGKLVYLSAPYDLMAHLSGYRTRYKKKYVSIAKELIILFVNKLRKYFIQQLDTLFDDRYLIRFGNFIHRDYAPFIVNIFMELCLMATQNRYSIIILKQIITYCANDRGPSLVLSLLDKHCDYYKSMQKYHNRELLAKLLYLAVEKKCKPLVRKIINVFGEDCFLANNFSKKYSIILSLFKSDKFYRKDAIVMLGFVKFNLNNRQKKWVKGLLSQYKIQLRKIFTEYLPEDIINFLYSFLVYHNKL